MASPRRSAAVVAGSSLLLLALLALLSCCVQPVQAIEILRAISPAIVKSQFSYGNDPGLMYSEPSLFGLPNYRAEVQAKLKFDTNPDNAAGCLHYRDDFGETTPDGQAVPIVALVARGGTNCTFGQKALRAQEAGAVAIIVYNSTDGGHAPLPKMSGGSLTDAIRIPGMLVGFEDGNKLAVSVQSYFNARKNDEKTNAYYRGVFVSLIYSIQAPDDRIEWDLYTYPDEQYTQPFLAAFQPVVDVLGPSALFTPHYRIMDGDMHGCLAEISEDALTCKPEDLPCGNQCTNCGRYCRVDPNGDPDAVPDGADVVTESAVQKCIHLWGVENSQPQWWWQYVVQRQRLNCGRSTAPTICSAKALDNINAPAALRSYIQTCQGVTDLFLNDDNDLLEDELQWAIDWQPLTSPYLFVNNFTYFGSYACATPINVGTCGPLSMMCQGFLEGTQPDICNSDGCDVGVARDACGVCGGPSTSDADCTAAKKASFPIGPVIGVIIVCCALIGGAVYYYMRRQNVKMRDDIDSLLKQYLPLDGQTGLAPSNGKSPPGGGQNQNLRLIGNLDSADEPTEL